jgi:hypothetical protein
MLLFGWRDERPLLKLFDAGRRNDLKAAESRRGSLDKAFKVGERGTGSRRLYYPLQLLGIAMYVNFYVRSSVRKGFMRRSLCEGVD